MRIAIYGWGVEPKNFEALRHLLVSIHNRGWVIELFRPLANWLSVHLGEYPPATRLFEDGDPVDEQTQYLLSIGGDGTFLDSIQHTLGTKVPVVGINFGHLGFLASAQTSGAEELLDALETANLTIERRVTIEAKVQSDVEREELPEESFIGLNDVTLKSGGKSMLHINAYVDDTYLCTYWADGLIVSTPTGSTAYSLSVGGPIMVPEANTFVFAPIAPHNLTLRPLVVSNQSLLHLYASSRDGKLQISVDSQYFTMDSPARIHIRRSAYDVQVGRLSDDNFFAAIREKLKWGADARI